MTLTFNLFGFDIAKIELTLPESATEEVSVIDKGAKFISREFFKRMVRG